MRPLIPKCTASLCVAILLAAGIPSALAKEDVCKADAEKFCQGVEPGEGRILKCLNQHEAELSPACRETVSAWMQKLSEGPEPVLPACKQDAARLCQGVVPGQGRIATCLKEHEAELSQECKDAVSAQVQKAKESAEAVAPACRPFVEQYCKDVQPGHGRTAVCLKAHASELSQECKEAVSSEILKVQPVPETVSSSCRKDVARLCQGVPAGQGRLAVCLKSHDSELSSECREALGGKAEKKGQKAEQKIERTRQKAEKKIEKTQEKAGIQPEPPAETTGER